MQESMESSPETATQDETQTETTEPSLQSLAELLTADETQSEESDNPETDLEGKPAGDGPEKGKPKSLKALAEKLELQDKDLYAIEVPMANGESKTLGQLKDLVAKQDEFALRELEFEETRQKREGDLLRAQNELRELIGSLPSGTIKPEMLEAVRQKHETRLKTERAKTLEAIPEWRDESKQTEDITGMIEHLESYGFPKNYIQTIFDSRTFKYIRDNWLREQRIRKALEMVKVGKPPTTSRSKPSGKAPRKPSATSRGKNQPRNGLEQLFSELK